MTCEYVSSVRDCASARFGPRPASPRAIAGRADVARRASRSRRRSRPRKWPVAPRTSAPHHASRGRSGCTRWAHTRQPDFRKGMERHGASRGRGKPRRIEPRSAPPTSTRSQLTNSSLVANNAYAPGSPGPWKTTLKARHFGRRRGRSPTRRYSGGEETMIRTALPARPATSPTLAVPAATSPA